MRSSEPSCRSESARWRAAVRGASWQMRALSLLLLFAVGWFAVNLSGPVGPVMLLWVPAPVAALLLTGIFLRTSRVQQLVPAARRFWRHLTVLGALLSCAVTTQVIDVLRYPDAGGLHITPLALSFYGAALVVVVYAMHRLPFKARTPGELLRICLDAGTVLLGASVFLWYFRARPSASEDSGIGVAATMVLVALAMLGVLTITKVALADSGLIDKTALRLLAFGLVLGCVVPITLEPMLAARPHLTANQVCLPLVVLMGGLAGQCQRLAGPGPRRGAAQGKRRPFSLLPYVAIAAVDGLLIAVTWTPEGADESLIVLSAVLLTGLVVLRQMTAFRDNGRLLAQLDHGATHDGLTQLPNRTLFGQRLHRALTSPGERPVGVALIDLDDFKEVNDSLGHEVGDQLLVAVAQRLKACVRVEDTVARLGGDEFVVVLDGAGPAAADQAVNRMLTTLRDPVLAGGYELSVRASIGIANGRSGEDAGTLLRHADIAMYAAKKLPGSSSLHYQSAMAAAVNDHATLGAQLREAIADDQLFLLYQPIVALDSGRVLGAEALVRWAHPVHGTMMPETFIPLAERTGLIVPLSRWVLAEACRQLAAWTAAYGAAAPAVLNVNISARDLRDSGLTAEVAAILAEYGIAGERLVLEVTETVAIELGTAVGTLDALRELGIRISLDDFGTGRSTLTLLHDCPVDEIKLDRSFVQAEPDDRPPVAAAVILLAQALGLHAIAEGVQNAEQADRLLSLGYRAAQGYHFGAPMLPAAFDGLLGQHRELALVE